ncbi:CinA family protein [Eubacterium oxidoreducens]|uniref:Nicotinamide-nucleotide amidase n=1 Tax=Eubacterium oxidoreducens TaxID=1732 RepID=A0A1G6AMG1_EUBOX|nr:CinA family protein [Eubacterium oxidoreducens]SDB09540.1 nicotinamide-nucleotide amidase [Eubacterium oxidoreducens]
MITQLAALLNNNHNTVSTAESCTGGLIAAELTSVAGSSSYFQEGYITYSNDIKEKNLGVSHETLERYGAVSEYTCKEMLLGLLHRTSSDYGIAVTGIAGPGGGTEKKPVGLVYIGCGSLDDYRIYEEHFTGNREQIRRQTVTHAIRYLVCQIKERSESLSCEL